MDKKEIRIQELKMPRGYARLISLELDVTEQHVYDVKAGQIQNSDVILRIFQIALEHKQKEERNRKALENIIELF